MSHSDIKQLQQRIGDHWSAKAAPGPCKRLGWWQVPYLLQRINEKVCGERLTKPGEGIVARAKAFAGDKLPFAKGIAVGCGAGQKEMEAIRGGVVSAFDLYELSEERIRQGKNLAERWGLADRVQFIHGDAFELTTGDASYDLVYWNNSLHHMMDVQAAVAWSHRVLRKGGLFCMDDFVGASRFQWSDRVLSIASGVRAALPDLYLRNPMKPGEFLPREVRRPNIERMIEKDPSEAADSERILDSVRANFPNAEITPTGGIIYLVALSYLLDNFDEEKDRALLDALLVLDDACVDAGLTAYATALAIR